MTITLAYLMFTKGLGLNEAFTFVRSRKPDVSPNFHFLEQLDAFERQLKNDPNRRVAPSASSSSSTPSGYDPNSNTPSSATSSNSSSRDHRSRYLSRHVKYSCACNEVECKCMQQDYLLGPGTGVSPDSGIEFDRWTSTENTPK